MINIYRWYLGALIIGVGLQGERATHASQFMITGIESPGAVAWEAETGRVPRVEWAASPTSVWSSSWSPLTNIYAHAGEKRAEVPMLYRVVRLRTNDAPSLPDDFNEVFGHHFYDPARLTLSNGLVRAVEGSGSSAFPVTETTASGLHYPAPYVTRPSGMTAITGGTLSSTTGPDLSAYTDFTMVFVAFHTYAGTTLAGVNIFGSLQRTNATATAWFQNSWTTQAGVTWQRRDGTTVIARNSIEDKEVHLIVYTRRNGVINLYVDGVLAGTGASTEPLEGAGVAYNGFLSSGSQSVAGSMGLLQASFYDRGLTVTEVGQLDHYFRTVLFPLEYKTATTQAKPLWIYNSNSIGKGYYYGNANTPFPRTVARLQSAHSKTIDRWYNVSKGGITTPLMSQEAPDYVDPYWAMAAGKKNLVLHEGTNDIALNNVTGAEAYAHLRQYWQDRQAAGCDRVFVATILPRSTFDAAKEQARLDCNALIRAHAVANGATAVIDFDLNANLLDFSNTTYYLDGIHPTQEGVNQMAITMAAALAPYL